MGAIQARIEAIRQHGITAQSPAAAVAMKLGQIAKTAIDDSFAEFAEQAEMVRRMAMESLLAFHDTAVEREAREAELARLRAENERLERERMDREATERAARLAAEREARAKAEAERLERERAEATARAAQQAAERERQRIAAEQRAAEEEQRRREENTRIRNRVRRAMVDAVSSLPLPLTADGVVDAIIAGKVPHTSVRF